MGVTVKTAERTAAYAAAVDLAMTALGEERGYINPRTRICDLSLWEWDKLANGMVSGWIIERSRQVVSERITDDAEILKTFEEPEPFELGAAAVALPTLGNFIADKGLNEKPIGAWSKTEILQFVHLAARLVNAAETARDERPGPATYTLEETLMAG